MIAFIDSVVSYYNVCKKYFLSLWTETVGLHAVQSIEILQDQAQRILVDYTRSRYPQQPGRIGRLMILVGYLRCVSSKTVERLFFHETIGEIPISRLLVDMYQMERYINWKALAHKCIRTSELAAFQNSSDSFAYSQWQDRIRKVFEICSVPVSFPFCRFALANM